MSEFARIITKSKNEINLKNLEAVLKNTDMELEVVAENGGSWNKIILKRNDFNQNIAIITKAEMIEDEKSYLLKGIEGAEPLSSADWIKKYIESAEQIYKFELFEGADDQYGWYSFESVREAVWEDVDGIFQDDGEGYKNEEGFYILWQFEYEVEGPYEAAVLDKKGKWLCFEMELSDEEHITQFKNGKVPQGLEILEF